MPFTPVHDLIEALPVPGLPKTFTQWIPGASPMSTHTEVFAGLAVYLAVIFGGQRLMVDRKAYQLKPLFMLHNFLLSATSGLVLLQMLEEIIPIMYNHGPFYSICHVNAWTPVLEKLYLWNYLMKYWEFVDTFFLVVKKKPLQFLHVFHHTATAALCYTQLNGRTSVSWVPIVANLTVHVLMYYYYFMTTAGYKIWWKKYLTTLQITQFVVDIFIVYFASYSYFVAEYLPGQLPTYGSCAGSEGAAVFGCSLLTSYLFLFIAFYKKTYNAQKGKAANPKGKAAAVVAKKTQ